MTLQIFQVSLMQSKQYDYDSKRNISSMTLTIQIERLPERFEEKFEGRSSAMKICTICDYRLHPGSSVAGEPLSAYKRMNVESWMWRWLYPTGWYRSATFSSVRHWVLIEREVRRGVRKLSVGLRRKGAKEGVKMTTTTLGRSPSGIIIYYRRVWNRLNLERYMSSRRWYADPIPDKFDL